MRRRRPLALAILPCLLLSPVASACGDPGSTALERSCRGERVLECDPHEYTAIRSATLEPAHIGPNDPTVRATLHVEIDACEMRPGPVEVQLYVLVPRAGSAADAGPDAVRVIDLGVALRDDGTGEDAAADDGTIDRTIANPFGAEIPAEADVVVRLVPVLDGCQGDPLELAHRTGRLYEPPPTP